MRDRCGSGVRISEGACHTVLCHSCDTAVLGVPPWRVTPVAQFLAVCSSAKTGHMDEPRLSVSDLLSRPEARLIHAGAGVGLPPLQRPSGGGHGGSGGALAHGGQPGPSPRRRAAGVGTQPRGRRKHRAPGLRGLLAVPAARAAPAGGRAGRAPLAGSLRPSHGTPSQEGSVWHVLRPF